MKHTFRRIVSLIMLCVCLCLSVFGCGGTPQGEEKEQASAGKQAQTVYISIDEWIGYWSLLAANGGLKTTPDSINARNGINITYVPMNDATASSNALISNDIQGAGYTVNRYAFLQQKFDNAGVDVIMPYITNYSNGGDGIISKKDIVNISDLVGKKIAVPQFSESHTMVEWLINNSALTEDEKAQITIVPFETADETAKAFFSGEVDAAATWEPYLTEARALDDSRVLFSTAMSTNLILSGMIFRQDFLQDNEDFTVKMIDGALEAADLYKKDFDSIRQLPMFELMTDEEIVEMANGADLATARQNEKLLTDTAVKMYSDMAEVWIGLGETAFPEKAESAFTDKYILPLLDKYPESGTGEKVFSEEEKAKIMESPESLLNYSAKIMFEWNKADILQESYGTLDEFVRKKKSLNNMYIQIEGHAAQRAQGVSEQEIVEFSGKRAQAVADYFEKRGISRDRMIVVGMGDSTPADPENPASDVNRRTEFYFKTSTGY